MSSWESKSSGDSGNFNPPEPNVSEGQADPANGTTRVSEKVGFGHDWTPPSSGADQSSGGFPTTSGSPFAGGDSASRSGSNTNISE